MGKKMRTGCNFNHMLKKKKKKATAQELIDEI